MSCDITYLQVTYLNISKSFFFLLQVHYVRIGLLLNSNYKNIAIKTIAQLDRKSTRLNSSHSH